MAVAQIQPNHRDLLKSLGAWVSQLVDDFPDYDEYDLAEIIEERTGLMVGNEDFDAIRALYLRAKLQEYRPDDEEGEA